MRSLEILTYVFIIIYDSVNCLLTEIVSSQLFSADEEELFLLILEDFLLRKNTRAFKLRYIILMCEMRRVLVLKTSI